MCIRSQNYFSCDFKDNECNTLSGNGENVKAGTMDSHVAGHISISRWTSPFTKHPRNAGDYIPQMFVTTVVDGVMVPPQEDVAFKPKYLFMFTVGLSTSQSIFAGCSSQAKVPCLVYHKFSLLAIITQNYVCFACYIGLCISILHILASWHFWNCKNSYIARLDTASGPDTSGYASQPCFTCHCSIHANHI